ncbi:glutamine--fructose-6-phosphate transaminase (isomerizing) [candidate division KSB1 bacterium]|nr:glutamine--fructose-6-phosphate transaminase (isomerizing) [candidate division KSB1 bacterium]RQW11468.1 MAG: glutamine--fructose-6-phosphate transaminase (isomerizing) [candidate division KSB1 bacterium]
MCGIVGYIGGQQVVPILLHGLKRLEYRGYDSAGIAIRINGSILVEKQVGKIVNLEKMIKEDELRSTVGIGHTRWATHGEPNQINAHPHTDQFGKIALVHNGIIENYESLRNELKAKGYVFRSETDTEVLAHLFMDYIRDGCSFFEAIRQGLSCVHGTYGLVVMYAGEPDCLIAARQGSPLVVGHGHGEYFIASDAAPLVGHTTDVTYMEDGEVALVSSQSVVIKTIDDLPVQPHVECIDGDLAAIEKGGYAHYMLKEIMEQPQTIRDTMRGRLLLDEGTAKLGGIQYDFQTLLNANRLIITACGTSWHAALIGEYMLEEHLGIPVEVEYASEFRYRDPILRPDSIVIAISQSGETADTLAAIRETHRKGSKVFGICNVVGSTIARETDAGVYLHAGPEIGVASTKAFTSQVVVLALMTLLLGRMRSLSHARGVQIAGELADLPNKVARALATNDVVRQIAEEFQWARNFLYLGRGYNFPVALEGALKLKEISYIHAEGYPAAEMKHGPIALIDKDMPVVFIATKDSIYDKVLSNIEEVRSRHGRVIAVATEGDAQIASHVDRVIYVPQTIEFLNPLVTIIPLQLLAYHIAVLRGCDVDQPRNLAKSVTVE